MTQFTAQAVVDVEEVGSVDVGPELQEEFTAAIEPDLIVEPPPSGGATGGVTGDDSIAEDLLDFAAAQVDLLDEIVDSLGQSAFDAARRGGGGGGGGLPLPVGRLASVAGGSLGAGSLLVGAPVAALGAGLLGKGTNGFSEGLQLRNLARGEGKEGVGIQQGEGFFEFAARSFKEDLTPLVDAFDSALSAEGLQSAVSALQNSEALRDPINEENIPKLELPSIPKLELPSIPELEVPSIPKLELPSIPELELPSEADIPDLGLAEDLDPPTLDIPNEIPKLGVPDVPDIKIGDLSALRSTLSEIPGVSFNDDDESNGINATSRPAFQAVATAGPDPDPDSRDQNSSQQSIDADPTVKTNVEVTGDEIGRQIEEAVRDELERAVPDDRELERLVSDQVEDIFDGLR